MGAEVSGGGNIEIYPWLKSMPVAPEYHPTLAEFQDPIAYIFKIEKEASQYGICKIVPPVPAASKKTIIANLNRSLLARSNDPDSGPRFTTRQQQIGFCPRKHRPVQKPVWQSGERYTLSEFEAKAKSFEKGYLKKYAKKELNALEIETLYWKATVDKPFDVEYANDMPGSAFVPKKKSGGKKNEGGVTVGDTEWNMRGVSRANSSLLRFMKEDIPGVTSPMVYVAMMFSWFAWHVEDHDLHSLNYLHMGAGKTWYGVPRDAAVAFEEVIREHGYGGEINPLVTFSTLGEKNTVMSPQVLRNAGVPCCRLVQNAGDFVITFPRAYHSGFSHGFNCGEASNIATPEWLRVAKEAAIRRASINCPPMVSHFQLLYDLALSLCSSVPKSISAVPRSLRLKDKKKNEGEMLIKELFSQDMMQNNNLLHILGKGSPVVLLPQNSLTNSKSRGGSHLEGKSRLFPSLCSSELELQKRSHNFHEEFKIAKKQGMKKQAMGCAVNGKFQALYNSHDGPSQMDPEMRKNDSHSVNGLFSCVTCGILCFACVAIVQPTEAAASYLMSADCSVFSEWGIVENDHNCISDAKAPITSTYSESVLKNTLDGLEDIPVCASSQVQISDDKTVGPSSLGLLALAYGNSSDSEEDEAQADIRTEACGTHQSDSLENGPGFDGIGSKTDCGNEVSTKVSNSFSRSDSSEKSQTNNCTLVDSNSLNDSFRHQMKYRHDTSNCTPMSYEPKAAVSSDLDNRKVSFSSRADEDSSRLHVFCLQHAIQVEKWLTSIGGANVFLVCHPDYPKLESQARKIAKEMEKDDVWSEISFREATDEDEETMRLALDSENAIHGNGDWAVKMGINLFYSANLSRSPLYSKQMPYNFIVYSAFGRSSPVTEGVGRQRKIVFAGKWCGKVWMSSQAHPLLVNKDLFETELKHEISSKDNETCRTGRKRTRTAKTRCVEAEKLDEISQDFTLSTFIKQTRSKNVTKLLTKEKTPEAEESDESSEESNEKIISRRQTKRLKKEIPESENLDESSEESPITTPEPQKNQNRSKKQLNLQVQDEPDSGPSTRLRKRAAKHYKDSLPRSAKSKPAQKKQQKDTTKKGPTNCNNKAKKVIKDEETGDYSCDIEGCTMSFGSKHELTLHKRNTCPVKGCGKKFFSHKYLVQHRRVHMDDRPLKCPWKGCKMTFKWAWARTEHIRVHTGARPYVCTEAGCGQTFRFVSDFSRHKRKTGHIPKKAKG